MACIFKRNKKGEAIEATLPNGKKSKLFEEILKVPNINNEQAIEIFEYFFSEEFKEEYSNVFGQFISNIENIENKPDAFVEVLESNQTHTNLQESNEIKKVAIDIMQGAIIANRLPNTAEKGRVLAGQKAIEATLLLERVNLENEDIDIEDLKDLQIEALEKYAKENDMWYEDVSDFGENTGIGGDENRVFRKENEAFFTKVNNFIIHETLLEFFDRIAIHNALFPETKIEVLGFLRDKDRNDDFSVVIKQPIVDINEDKEMSEEEIESFMLKKGFEKQSKGTYFNEQFILDDIVNNNIVELKDGSITVLDEIGALNTEDEGLDGEQTFGKMVISENTLNDEQLKDENINDIVNLINQLSDSELFRMLLDLKIVKQKIC